MKISKNLSSVLRRIFHRNVCDDNDEKHSPRRTNHADDIEKNAMCQQTAAEQS